MSAAPHSTREKWRDNHMDYVFEHSDQVTVDHGLGIIFGLGADGQAHLSSSGQPPHTGS
jgi:hypothetical protein